MKSCVTYQDVTSFSNAIKHPLEIKFPLHRHKRNVKAWTFMLHKVHQRDKGPFTSICVNLHTYILPYNMVINIYIYIFIYIYMYISCSRLM